MLCSQCLTEKGNELTRVSLVDPDGNCVLDDLVKPENRILNYLTRYMRTHSYIHTHTFFFNVTDKRHHCIKMLQHVSVARVIACSLIGSLVSPQRCWGQSRPHYETSKRRSRCCYHGTQCWWATPSTTTSRLWKWVTTDILVIKWLLQGFKYELLLF